MIPRRGFLATLAGALGAAFLPKARGEKKFVLPHKPPPVSPPVFSEFKGSFPGSTMAHVTAHSPIVVCDSPLEIQLGDYVIGQGLPLPAQVVGIMSRGTFLLDSRATETCYTSITVDRDKSSTIVALDMREIGNAFREMLADVNIYLPR